MQQARDEGELGRNPVPQGAGRDVIKVAPQITHHTTRVTLELSQCLAHAAERLCMGMAADLQGQSRGQAGIGLPQVHPDLLRQGGQLRPRPLIEPGIGGMGEILLPDASAGDASAGDASAGDASAGDASAGKWGPTPIF